MRASVPASRRLTMTATATPMPFAAAHAPPAGRLPGTTTAPGGTTSGSSAVPWISRSSPTHDHAVVEATAAADEGVVLDHHRARPDRLQHAAHLDRR
jgi:hypothetical protein